MAEAKLNLYNELGALVQTGASPLAIPVESGVTYTGYSLTHLNYDGTKESNKVVVPDFTDTTTTTTTVAPTTTTTTVNP